MSDQKPVVTAAIGDYPHTAPLKKREITSDLIAFDFDDVRPVYKVFGAMVRYYRERAGLSRAELARQICKSVSLVQAIELGQRAATAEVTGDLEAASPYRIEVKPGNTTVPRGSDQIISAKIQGFASEQAEPLSPLRR